MIKNNIFDKNQLMNDRIEYGDKKVFLPNIEHHFSTGIKSDLEAKKVGSDTCSYWEYHN